MNGLLTISEIAKRSGVAASALRFYEQRGLIRSERAGSGHRRYPRAVLRRVAFIVFAQKIGLSLDEIAEELRKSHSVLVVVVCRCRNASWRTRVIARRGWDQARGSGSSKNPHRDVRVTELLYAVS
jgi:DNA-binding transcriptional MerR regulator